MDSVGVLALKRVLATLLGTSTAVIVTSYIWGFKAHKELRRGISLTINQLGELYSRSVTLILTEHDAQHAEEAEIQKKKSKKLVSSIQTGMNTPPSRTVKPTLLENEKRAGSLGNPFAYLSFHKIF